ncbi:deaminase, partial [Streptomyces brasiliscabiei]
VYEDQIIGEGWHAKYGEAHAEVNCLQSVDATNTDKIPKATLFVSLEPCAHYGKTPPCTNLIIQRKIQRVVVGCVDPFKEVAGKGIN